MSCDFNLHSLPPGIFKSLIFRNMQYFRPRVVSGGIIDTCTHSSSGNRASFLWVCRGLSMSDSSDDERPGREEEVSQTAKKLKP